MKRKKKIYKVKSPHGEKTAISWWAKKIFGKKNIRESKINADTLNPNSKPLKQIPPQKTKVLRNQHLLKINSPSKKFGSFPSNFLLPPSLKALSVAEWTMPSKQIFPLTVQLKSVQQFAPETSYTIHLLPIAIAKTSCVSKSLASICYSLL